MMIRMKAIKRKGGGLISKLMYIIAGLLALISITLAGSISYDSMYYSEKVKGYTLDSLDDSFSDEDYGTFMRKIAYNKAYGRTITDDEQDYYTFAEFYENLVNYNINLKNGDVTEADENLKACDEYYNQLQHRVFKEKADKLRSRFAAFSS